MTPAHQPGAPGWCARAARTGLPMDGHLAHTAVTR